VTFNDVVRRGSWCTAYEARSVACIAAENRTETSTDLWLQRNKNVFCDLAKAFDCVNHGIWLSKLHYFGIQGATASLFRSYLTERKQKFEIKSPYSTQKYPLQLGNHKAWSSTGVNLRAFAFHNLYK
jgi:hypothetical protein